jgi:hypothetical protein
MTAPVTFPVARVPQPSQHEVLVTKLAVDHDRGEHDSPLVACFKCLHGEAPVFATLRKAA